MSPAEDAALLPRIVRRHLQVMRLNLDPHYPDEEWVCQAQQPLDKLLKARLVLADRQPSGTHEFAVFSGQLLEWQVYAVQARYEEGRLLSRCPGKSSSRSWISGFPA